MRARLSYANVMATVAVFIALGGSSYAAIKVTGKNVTNGSLTGADIKNNSIASGDVKNGSLLKRDFRAGQLPAGAQGPTGPRGAPGTPGAPGSAVAYALVLSDGQVPAATAKNVTAEQVQTGPNRYCINTSVPISNAVATNNSSFGHIRVMLGNDGGQCPAGTEATVYTADSHDLPALSPRDFFIAFN